MNSKVSIFSIFCIVSLSIGLNNHVLLIPMILQSGHRDAWFGAIIGTILACLWTFALYIVLRNIRQQSLRMGDFSWAALKLSLSCYGKKLIEDYDKKKIITELRAGKKLQFK